ISDGANQLDVLLGHSADCHAGHGTSVGHFCETHDDLVRRSLLCEQIVVYANDGAIPNDPAVRERRARFEKIWAGECLVCPWSARLPRGYGGCATNIASRFSVVRCRIERTTGRHWQLKRVNEQFSLKLFRKPCARIRNRFASDGISGVLLKFFHSRADGRKFLCGNVRQIPSYLRGVDLEKSKAQVLARAGKHLRGRKDEARFFRPKRRAPA